ncbi:MAG: MinD/ParA family protein [bacterium]|nr:MinD/ParA family protein [bacterium]
MRNKKGKIITVTSTKGGVGKTIFALNLAGVYSNLGYKTLVIDLDLYGGAVSTYLNSTNDHTIYNLILDLNNNKYKRLEDYLYTYNENIDILSAPKDPRNAKKIDPKYIPVVLNNALYKYDVILIDTSHNLNDVNILALDNSDYILYIFTNDTFDLKNTKSFISIMKDVGYNNYYMILNNSILNKNYYSLYDIRNLLGTNIDFTISKSMHIKNIDKYLLEGQILILNKNLLFTDKNESKKLNSIALKLLDEEEK